MTKDEISYLTEKVLTLYIDKVKQYYDQPKYTEQITPHTMLGQLWRVLDQVKTDVLTLENNIIESEITQNKTV